MLTTIISAEDYGWAFGIGVGLNLVFVFIEAEFGWWADSLALLADAGHNLSDVLGLSMAWGGYALAKVAPSSQRTYGWRGSTILAALFNSAVVAGRRWRDCMGSDRSSIPAHAGRRPDRDRRWR